MEGNSSILKSVLGYSISSWANLLLGFLYVIASTRLLLPETYGRLSLFYSVSSVAMYALTMGMDGALIRFYNEPPGDDTTPQLLYKNIVLSTIICLLIFVFAIFFFYDTFSDGVFGFPSRILTGMFLVYTASQILFRYLNISFRMSFKTTKYNVQNILTSGLLKCCIIIAAFFSEDFIFIISFLTIGIVALLILYLYVQRNEYFPINKSGVPDFTIRLKGYGAYMRYAMFSAPSYITSYLNLYLGQQIIISSLGAYSLGIFASVGIFSQILMSIRGGFATFWLAYVFKYSHSQKDKIIRMHDFIVAFAIIGISCLVLFRDFIYLFIGNEFHDSKSFFSVLLIMPILIIIQETTVLGIFLEKRNEFSLLNNIGAIIINIVVSLLLINVIGLLGAAIANAVSGIYLYVSNTLFGQHYYKSIDSKWKSILGTIMIVAILIVPVIFSFKNAVVFIIVINFFSFSLYKREHIHVVRMIANQIRINKNLSKFKRVR